MTRSLIRWNPTGDLIRSRMSRLVDDAFNDFLAPAQSAFQAGGEAWAPAVDISEDDEALRFLVEMPGMTKDDVEITLEDNSLSLRGERKFERDEESTHYHRIERAHGSFSRTFHLPSNVDSAQATARFDNGVLEIAVPKTAEAKPRRLEIG